MWLRIPKTSSHYTQEEEDLTSDLDWLFPMLEQSVMWRERSRQSRSWSTASKKESWMMHLFGQIPQPSMAARGLEKWIGSLEDSRVSRGQSQVKEKEKKTKDGFGMTSSKSLCRYNPQDSSWRMFQVSLLDMELTPYLETFPKWGSMRNGECWERVTLARLTEGIESGSLRQMTTPTANKWPTPAAHIAIEGGYPAERRRNEHTLTAQAIDRPRWPTPQASDWKLRYPTKNWKGEDLVSTVNQREGRKPKNWPTPQASDNRDRGCLSTPAVKRRQKKGKQISLSMSASDKCGRLNPHWVAWLMGWPMGWTEASPIDPLVMEDWRRKTEDGTWWLGEPEGVPRVDGSNENRTPRLKALGNGQVPLCAAMAWELLTRRLT